ncbi:MAG: bifunctional folylpolyglutamate synthase/dihydrofolate synthase [Planctomycetia bacterium]
MTTSRNKRHTRASALAWLDRRINFERAVPASASPGTFGLARVRRLLTAIGNPHHAFPVVHVAGTKGKGSTVAMLAAVLQAAGHRVGRYLSPHVDALEERICIGGRPISAADLVRAFNVVIPAVERMDAAARRRGGGGPTWFEVLTAVAFVHFARARVDLAVLETGLGGRLDATNVSRPVLSIITSISLDHMHLLGSTIGAIATEKAGIIKRGCPVISSAIHPEARRVIEATAARRRAPLSQLGRDFTADYLPADSHDPLAPGRVAVSLAAAAADEPLVFPLAMRGGHQAVNAAVVVMAAKSLDARGYRVTDRAVAKGLAAASLPARIERVGEKPLVILDAAHNVASMESLMATLAPAGRSYRPTVLLFAASADKQIPEMLAVTRGRFDHVVITRYATNPRAATVPQLVEACRRAGLPAPRVATAPAEALRLARELATPRGLVCVAGSFFLAAEIRAVL